MARYQDSGYDSISAMMKDKNCEIPKYANKNVCLVWALKGKCHSGCKRATNHKSYPSATNKAIHKLLTDCGVPGSQE